MRKGKGKGMRNLLSTDLCSKFQPTFDNRECAFYQYPEDSNMEIISGVCGFCKQPGAYRCIADVTRHVPLSHSSIGDFLTCHRLYYLKKILGIEMRPAFFGNPLKAGKLWDILKQKHLGGNVDIKATIEEYEIPPMIVAKVRALYHAYKELEIEVDPGGELQAKVDMEFDVVLSPSSFIPSVNINEDKVNLWADRIEQKSDERTWMFPVKVAGFYDRKYETYFTEDKLSGRPEFYLNPFYIQSQMGTYFLADPNLEYVIMEVVQFPQQRENKKREESPDEMYNRVYGDILSRPSKYFIGYDKQKKRYGRKFFRGEFDLDEIKRRYQQVVLEILSCRYNDNFYKNFQTCGNVYGRPCEFQKICKNGNVSENMFKIRGK